MSQNRSGAGMRRRGGPAYGEETLLEQNMPDFRGDPKKRAEWLAGKPARQELTGDFRKLGDGLAMMTRFNSELDSKVEELIRLLAEKGVFEISAYRKGASEQLQFKQTLDAVNFLMKEVPMKDRTAILLNWNETHPNRYIHGSYFTGFAEWVKKNPDKLSLEDRFNMVSGLHLDPQIVFTAEELAELATPPPEVPPDEKQEGN